VFGFAAPTKSVALIAVEVRPAGWLHRARLTRIKRLSQSSLSVFAREVADPRAVVELDKFEPEVAASYSSRLRLQRLIGPSSGLEAYPVTRLVETVHRWWGAAHRGDRAVADFDGLLAEFCFYYNRRRRKNRNAVQQELLRAALTTH
jgi:hypothetical protein